MILLLRDFLLNPVTDRSIKKLSLINFLYLFFIEFVLLNIVTVLSDHIFGSYNAFFIIKTEEILDNILIFIVIAVIIFPIYEEFLHRYYLKGRVKSLCISAILLLFHFFLTFDQHNFLLNIIHFYGFLFIMVMGFIKKVDGLINIKVLVWGSIIFFGLFHTGNYDSEVYTNNYLIIPVLVMPQFIGGFFLAFLRIRYSLLHSILYHCFFNLVITILGLIEHSYFPDT